MKKQIPHFIILMLCFLLAGNVYGQALTIKGAATSAIGQWPHRFNASRGNQHLSTQSADMPISYFDSSIPTLGIGVPTIVGPDLIPTYGERITLPGASGFIDSVQVTLDSITADSILVYLAPDTLYLTSAGEFHLMNIFDPNAQTYEVGYIQANQVHGKTTITLPLPHVAIYAQNFWVAVEPNFNKTTNEFTNGFRLIGDSEPVRPRTTDSSHSGYIAQLSNGQIFTAIYDSSFLSVGNQPLYSNFYITAFMDVSSSSVANVSENSKRFVIYPNPGSGKLSINIPSDDRVNSLELRDVLGRVVLSSAGETRSLDISKLLPGHYEAIINSSSGITVSPVVIQR